MYPALFCVHTPNDDLAVCPTGGCPLRAGLYGKAGDFRNMLDELVGFSAEMLTFS